MLLAIDTSTAWCGVCLYDTSQASVVDEQIWHSGLRHCEQLIPAIDHSLRRHGLTARNLTGVAVAVGPGTFNGVRVAVATAKLIARGVGCPVVGVNTLEIYAHGARRSGGLVRAILGAARQDVATAVWRTLDPSDRLELVESPVLAPVADVLTPPIESTLFLGELRSEWRDAISALGPAARLATPAESVRRPAHLAELGAARLRRAEADDLAALAPVYLRPPHISAPRA